MKILQSLLLLGSLFLSDTNAQAMSCRAGKAAQIGSQIGYEKAKKTADAWEKREQLATTTLQQCLGSLSTALTVPTFPDLSALLNGIKDKVCATAREKISGYIPQHLNPWEELNLPDYPLPKKTFSVTSSMPPDQKKGLPFTLN